MGKQLDHVRRRLEGNLHAYEVQREVYRRGFDAGEAWATSDALVQYATGVRAMERALEYVAEAEKLED